MHLFTHTSLYKQYVRRNDRISELLERGVERGTLWPIYD